MMNINDRISQFLAGTGLTAAVRRYRKPFLVFYLYSLVLYLPLLLLRLTNDIDGLWNQDDYAAGVWELSIGRWFWPYLDRARFNLSLDPLPGILALAVFVIGFMTAVQVLHRGSVPFSDSPQPFSDSREKEETFTPITFLAGFLFLASTAITCQMSHGYMVITFAVSFLLSVLSVRVLTLPEKAGGKGQVLRVLVSGVLTAFMMGAYQANIGTTCLLALTYFMNLLACQGKEAVPQTDPEQKPAAERGRMSSAGHGSLGSEKAFSGALRFAVQMLAGIVIGAVLYEGLLHLNLGMYGVTLSSYQGFSEIGPAYLLSHAGLGVRHAWQEVEYFFFTGVFRFNILETHRIFWLVYLVPAAAVLYDGARAFRNGLASGILYVISVLLVPVFAGSFYLLAPEAETHMQMLISYSLIIPFALLGYNRIPLGKADDSKGAHIRSAAVLAGIFFLIYGAVFMNETDQYAMYAGRRATSTLAENILEGAQALGQDPLNGEFEIIGVPSDSPLFSVKDLYYRANDYAQYGNWSSDVSFSRVSWIAMYRNYLRTNVSFAVGDTEQTIAELPETAAMPVFPAAGSIRNLYGVTVVRISGTDADP